MKLFKLLLILFMCGSMAYISYLTTGEMGIETQTQPEQTLSSLNETEEQLEQELKVLNDRLEKISAQCEVEAPTSQACTDAAQIVQQEAQVKDEEGKLALEHMMQATAMKKNKMKKKKMMATEPSMNMETEETMPMQPTKEMMIEQEYPITENNEPSIEDIMFIDNNENPELVMMDPNEPMEIEAITATEEPYTPEPMMEKYAPAAQMDFMETGQGNDAVETEEDIII